MRSSRTIRCSAWRATAEPVEILAKVKLRNYDCSRKMFVDGSAIQISRRSEFRDGDLHRRSLS